MKVRNIIITSAVTAGLILGHALLYAAESTQTDSAPGVEAASDSVVPASAKDAENPGWDNGAMPGPAGPGMRRDGFRKGYPDRGEAGRDRERQPQGDNPQHKRFASERDADRGPGLGPQGNLSPHSGPGFVGPGGMDGPMPGEKFGRKGMPPLGPFSDWKELQKCDPEMFSLLQEDAEGEMKTRMLTMQYRQAQGDSKENIGKQLEEAVRTHFLVRQKRRALELSRLEDELKRMKGLFEKRNQSQEQIIEQRIKTLKGDEENLF